MTIDTVEMSADEVEQLRADLTSVRAERDHLREQLADAEAALVEANTGRRLSNAEHLHQRLSAAALVIGRMRDWRYCPMCRDVREPSGGRHACGHVIPVDVILIRRPREQH